MLNCAVNFNSGDIGNMKRYLFIWALLTSLVSAGGCASIGAESGNKVLAQVDDAATGALQTRPAIVELNGKPAILYAAKDDRVALQIGGQRQLLDETARVRGGNHLQLHRQDQNLQALWWSHDDGKNIYFTSSADEGKSFNAVSMVNDEHGVLPPYSLTQGPQGVVGVTYQDERATGYQAYFNRSTDNGRSWARPDQRLDTPPKGRTSDVHEAQSVQSGTVWVSAWTDNTPGTGQASYRIVSRRSVDEGQSWSAPEVLYSADHQISSLMIRAQSGNMVIAADELNRGIIALGSQDEGRSWRSAGVLAGTEGASNSGIDMAVTGGRAHLVWMQDRKDEKTRIMRASLDVAQSKWLGAVQRLDLKSHENTRSTSPVILATPQGSVLASWVDFRDIRPNVYLSSSSDQGQAWSAPQALLKPGEVSAGWPQLLPWRDQVAIGYELYPTDRPADGKFVVRLLEDADSAKGLAGLPAPAALSEADRKARLEQRVKTMWDQRVAGNYEPTYDMFDFAYKAATPKKYYVDSVGVITYLSYAVGDIAIAGNEASVKMKLRYEVKPTVLPSTGKKITLPAADVESPTTWVWVANDWYMVYSPSFEPPQLKY